MSTESTKELAEVASHVLLAEGRCALSVARSSNGVTKLEIRTHALGKIDIELDRGNLEDLLFGLNEVDAKIVRAIPTRKPMYPANDQAEVPR